jgi:hypothetical protein
MQSLSFARVASVVRACAFKIGHGAHNLDADALARKLPFVGAARARQIWDLATTGTTEELEQHRCRHSHTAHPPCSIMASFNSGHCFPSSLAAQIISGSSLQVTALPRQMMLAASAADDAFEEFLLAQRDSQLQH